MFSKAYFNYLLKSKKYLLLFIFLITLLFVFTNKEIKDALTIQSVLCVGLCYFLPVYLFSYIHNKKAVDTFFSIPVSRKAMLITGLIFAILVAYIPTVLVTIIYLIKGSFGFISIAYIFGLLIGIASLITFNTLIYSIANNVLDGVIMIAAYSCLPIGIYVVLSTIASSYIAGFGSYNFDFVAYVSPVSQLVMFITGIFNKTINYLISLFVILVISFVLLYKSYKNRMVERADSQSTGFFAYPFIIHIYLCMCLFLISAFNDYTYANIIQFLKNNLIAYVALFGVYVAAHFIYKRKLFISYKLPLIFIVLMLLSILINSAFKQTQGFGLSQMYLKNDYYGQYNYNSYYYNEYDQKLVDNFEEKVGYKLTNYNVSVSANNYEARNNRLKLEEETIELFEKIRQEGINNFYNSTDSKASLMVNSYVGNISQYYSYGLPRTLTYDELLTLAKDKNVSVIIYTEYGEYVLGGNGNITAFYETVTYPNIFASR